MNVLDVYHGTKGDNILTIIKRGVLRPDKSGEIYFVQHDVNGAMQYGVDESRMACYAIGVRVEVPLTATMEQLERHGAPRDTVRVTTQLPIKAEVTEMYVRPAGQTQLITIKGITEIEKVLKR